jgi:hypothetical protein
MRCEVDFVSVALGLMRFICLTGRRSVVVSKGGGVVIFLLWLWKRSPSSLFLLPKPATGGESTIVFQYDEEVLLLLQWRCPASPYPPNSSDVMYIAVSWSEAKQAAAGGLIVTVEVATAATVRWRSSAKSEWRADAGTRVKKEWLEVGCWCSGALEAEMDQVLCCFGTPSLLLVPA